MFILLAGLLLLGVGSGCVCVKVWRWRIDGVALLKGDGLLLFGVGVWLVGGQAGLRRRLTVVHRTPPHPCHTTPPTTTKGEQTSVSRAGRGSPAPTHSMCSTRSSPDTYSVMGCSTCVVGLG